MALVITTSPNIAIFDFSATYNLNTQIVTLANLSTYIGGGAAATNGINFILTSPSGITYYTNTLWGVNSNIKPASPNTPFVCPNNLPSFQGAIEYGNWVAQGTIQDGNGTNYTFAYTLNICQPPSCSNSTNTSNSCANISFTANCNANKVIYEDKTVYVYKGQGYSQITYDVSMTYPPISAKSPILHANVPFFSDSPIFDGTYSLLLNNTATYTFGTQSVVIVYQLNQDYAVTCSIDLCGILCAYAEYIEGYQVVANDTNGTKFRTYQNNLILLNSVVNQAIINSNCGNDISEQVALIEFITGTKCNCQCGANNVQPVTTEQDIVITAGCGDVTVGQVKVGNTTTFTINDKSYTIESLTDGLNITTNLVGCTEETTVQICVDQLPLCSSVLVIPTIDDDFNRGAINVGAGTPLINVLEEIANTEGNLADNEVALNTRVADTSTRVDGLVTEVDSLLAIPTWNNISPINGWSVSFSPQYCTNLWSFVNLRGSVTKSNPTAGVPFCVVPAPHISTNFTVLVTVGSTQTMAAMGIDLSGNVTIDIGTNAVYTVYLDGLSYSTHA